MSAALSFTIDTQSSQGSQPLLARATTIRLLVQHLGRGIYRASLASTGEVLIDRAREPFFAVARTLIAMGFDRRATLEMARVTSPDRVDLKATLGRAAALTVVDNSGGTPTFRKFTAKDQDQ